ncbi:Fe2+-enterobactin ABC transporter substrate-binding protein [Sanguibacter sp. HDW7]|uniref:Fe2+-enterobactin ABC transporter substrate-binding protein n=1 Tax=Sanguibacter sp. HDW7 TaxID=2714931 RepID=UPI00140C7240|nr:Fe2+-enterobactin ABC transporter substrate-binding protein [Sanguibacter sp. HDW7]QIK83676.1 Fe2+-enterobactin ABC transporter substrate-binding protein [Sanguibacter sp. HDW7]
MSARPHAPRPTRARRLRTLVAATALAATVLGGCAAAPATQDATTPGAEQPTSAGWPRTIQTDDGTLTLDAQPQRIVSTSTTLNGSLLAIEAPVVASAATTPNISGLSDAQGFFSQWSAQAKSAGVAKLYENSSPDIEAALEHEPDLILVAKNSGDSVMDQVAQLRTIAPVLVIDYSGASWEAVTRKVAEATGREAKAEEVIASFETHLAEAKAAIKPPEGETSAFIVFGDGSGAAALTDKAPQVQVMTSLGFTMATIPDSVKGDTSMGADRQDMVNLSLENIQKGLTGTSWVVVSADDLARETVAGNKAFSTAPAVSEGKVWYTPGETFRLDYYSATMLVDSLVESFPK